MCARAISGGAVGAAAVDHRRSPVGEGHGLQALGQSRRGVSVMMATLPRWCSCIPGVARTGFEVRGGRDDGNELGKRVLRVHSPGASGPHTGPPSRTAPRNCPTHCTPDRDPQPITMLFLIFRAASIPPAVRMLARIPPEDSLSAKPTLSKPIGSGEASSPAVVFRRLWPYIKPLLWVVVGAIVAMAVSASTDAAIPAFAETAARQGLRRARQRQRQVVRAGRGDRPRAGARRVAICVRLSARVCVEQDPARTASEDVQPPHDPHERGVLPVSARPRAR